MTTAPTQFSSVDFRRDFKVISDLGHNVMKLFGKGVKEYTIAQKLSSIGMIVAYIILGAAAGIGSYVLIRQYAT